MRSLECLEFGVLKVEKINIGLLRITLGTLGTLNFIYYFSILNL
jgi:hypothetical protein